MTHNCVAVKKLFAWGLVFLCALQAFGQSNVLMQLSEANAYPTTNRPITIQATSPFFGSKVFIYSDTNGNALYNFNPGVLYNCQITAPPQAINFQIYVPPGTVGTAIDWTNVWGIGGGIATYPAGAVAPSIAMADARYLMSGQSLTNLYYPLTNPNGFVSNSVLLAASNGIIALIPGTNGFISYSITNQYWPSNYIGSTFAYESSLLATGTTLAASIVAATNAPWIVNTNQLLTRQLGSATLTNLSGITTNQIAFTNSPYFDPAGTAQAATNAAGQASGLLAYQPTNILSQYETTNGFANGTNTIYGVIYSQIAASNSTVNAYATNVFQVLSNYTTFASNTVQFSKQPASAILSNAVVTGINTNGYAAGVGSYLTTNTPGTIQSINVSPQTFLTNQMTPIVYEPLGFYLGTNSLPALTNSFTTQFNATNGYWPSNYVGSTFYPTSNPSGFTTQFLATNSYWPSNYVGLNFYPTSNPSGFSTQVQLTNFYMLGTNYANTNAQSLFQQSTNYANTNSSPYYVAATNGTATSLTIQSNLSIGTKTAWLYSTNDFGIDGPCGSPYVVGTYWGIPYGTVWTNNFYPWQTMVISAGVFYLQSNNVTLYSSANGQTWTVTPPGIAPAPVGHYGYDILNNGANYKGWIFGTNLTAQINGATVGGVVQGILSNEFFSTAGTNVIANLIAQLASTNSGASLNQVTNVINSFQFVSSNGATANGQQVYSTNTGLGWFWAAASSGGGGSTNGLATTNFVVSYVQTTSNALQGEISAGGIATLNGRGTNTSLTNFPSISGTNLAALTIQSSNVFSTNLTAQSGVINNEFDTNLTVVNDTWLNNSNLLVYYSGSGLIPAMTSSNTPSGLVTSSPSPGVDGDVNWNAFSGTDASYQNSESTTPNCYLQYEFANPVSVASYSMAIYVWEYSSTLSSNVLFQSSSDGVNFTTVASTDANLLIVPDFSPGNFVNFPVVTAQYFRWTFSTNTLVNVTKIQLYPLVGNILSNSITMQIWSTNGGVTVNTNTANGNAFEVGGNIDSPSSSTPNATETVATIGTANIGTNSSTFSYDQTFLADSVSANTVNAGGFSVNGVPVYFPSNAAAQFEYFVTNANATNQFLDPNNFNGIYQWIGVKTSGGFTVNVYSNLNGTTTNYLLSGAQTASSATNIYNFLSLTNGFTGSGTLFSIPVYTRAGSPVGTYIKGNPSTPPGSPVVSIYSYSNNVASLPYLASGPGGNYDASLVTNISNLAIANSGAITNIYGYEGLVVMPYLNMPPAITNSARYFGPWLGPNYVNLAVQALPQFTTNNGVGGGLITVVGTNYVPSTILFSNFNKGAYSYEFDSPPFSQGAIICATAPAIRVEGSAGYGGLGTVNFGMRGLIVASEVNTPTNVFEIVSSVANAKIDGNWFGFWGYLTNNYGSILVTPSFGLTVPQGNLWTNNLVVSVVDQFNDKYIFENNHLWFMAGLYWGADHGLIRNNFFTSCGAATNPIYGGGTVNTDIATGWTTNSPISLGACITMAHADPINEFNYFYGCYAGYAVVGDSGNYSLGYTMGDQYEGQMYSILSPTNVVYPQIFATPSQYGGQGSGTPTTIDTSLYVNNLGGGYQIATTNWGAPWMGYFSNQWCFAGSATAVTNLFIGGVQAFPVNSNSIVQWTNGSAIGTTIYGSPGLTNWTTFSPQYDTRTNSGTGTSETVGGRGVVFATSNLVMEAGYQMISNAAVIYSQTNVLNLQSNATFTLNGNSVVVAGGASSGTLAAGNNGTNYVWTTTPSITAITVAGSAQAGTFSGVASNLTQIWISNIVTNGQTAPTAGQVLTLMPDGKTIALSNAPSGGGTTGITNGQLGNVIVATNGTLGTSNLFLTGTVNSYGNLPSWTFEGTPFMYENGQGNLVANGGFASTAVIVLIGPSGSTLSDNGVAGWSIANGVNSTRMIFHTNTWNLNTATNGASNFDNIYTVSNTVPVIIYMSNSVPYIYDMTTSGGGIIP